MWGVDVDENVWGNGKERRPPSVGRQNGGRRFSAWVVPPDSLTTIGRCCGRWRSGKSGGADIMVAKEAGRWCWVIVDHFEWSVSHPIKAIIVINSNYGN